MKLLKFSVSNYRSITEAYDLELSDYTTIVGPNNEGKSNILAALALSLGIITSRSTRTSRSRFSGRGYYNRGNGRDMEYKWDRDFPISRQSSRKNCETIFQCEFGLSEGEFVEFHKQTGVNLNTSLIIIVSIGEDGIPKIDFKKKGPGKSSLAKKEKAVSDFIRANIGVQYIPAIRTTEISSGIIEGLLVSELSVLEHNSEYNEHLKAIQVLQKPILDQMSKIIQTRIKKFIPAIKKISIKNQDIRRILNSSSEILIDDGTETDISMKGDGIISLMALSLLQYKSEKDTTCKNLILLVEEPESHLHPGAIHNIKDVLFELSSNYQVMITTHSPILVNKLKVHQNILVSNGKASKANNLQQIRESLGIHSSDTLTHAALVLLVEGPDDKIIISKYLIDSSSIIKEAIASGILLVDTLGGGSNLSYKASFYSALLCNVIAFLDHDTCGINSKDKAIRQSIIDENDIFFAKLHGRKETELEDLLLIESYSSELAIEFPTLMFDKKELKGKDLKWSDKVKSLYINSGQVWSGTIESRIKYTIAKIVNEKGLVCFDQRFDGPLKGLMIKIESILSNMR